MELFLLEVQLETLSTAGALEGCEDGSGAVEYLGTV
jgi:hypothetical protein